MQDVMLNDVLPGKIKTGKEYDGGNGRKPVKIEKRSDGQLWIFNGKSETVVQARLCFPWSFPNRFISLRNSDDDEIALIDNFHDIDASSANVLKQALAEAGFVLEISKVLGIKEDFEIRSWNVMTRQGARKFQTRLDDWPHLLPDGGVVIRDVSGDLFYIEKPAELDSESMKHLQAYVE